MGAQSRGPPFTTNTQTSVATVYVGNLYEIEDSANGNPQRRAKSLFLGSTRIASITGSDIAYYHQDHLGSTNVMSDKTGLARSLTEYDPFGKISRFEKFGSKLPSGWQYFHDKPFDDESGLSFFGGRYYDSKLGRFITADTIVQAPDNPQTLNRYSYCGNNPINNIDPDGHSWFSKIFKSIGKFFSNLVEHPVQTILSIVGLFSGNPFLIAASVMSLVNIGTSSWQGGGWNTFHQVLGYASLASAVVGGVQEIGKALAQAPAQTGATHSGLSASIGWSDGSSVINLEKIVIGAPKVNHLLMGIHAAADWAQQNWNVIQAGMAVAGVIPGIGIGFDVANAGISAARGDWTGAGLSMVAAVPFVGDVVSVGRVGRAFKGDLVIGKFTEHGNPAFSLYDKERVFNFKPDLGTRANYERNMRALRVEMGKGLPIRDATPGLGGNFTKGERMTLENRGWKRSSAGGDDYWVPSGGQ